MFRARFRDERARLFGIDVERDGYDLEAVVMQAGAQCLPPGQVETAPSP
jgi:hypothetical protein